MNIKLIVVSDATPTSQNVELILEGISLGNLVLDEKQFESLSDILRRGISAKNKVIEHFFDIESNI